MTMFAFSILLVAAAYLFGSVPFMVFIGRVKNLDLSNERDLHHALFYKVGRGWAGLGVFMDVLKGALPILVGWFWNFPLIVTVLAALAGLCGQMWPVFRRFNGERGNTVALGIALTLSIISPEKFAPLVIIIAVLFAAAGMLIRMIARWQQSGSNLKERLKFRGSPSMSLPIAILVGLISLPITSWLVGQPAEIVWGYIAYDVVILVRRVTADLFADLRRIKKPWSVIFYRLLLDRSEL
jgi:acyl phosphate:glycerol-3-phosphate acyltransferase